MKSLNTAINLLSLIGQNRSEFREFIREELPEPRPAKRWFSAQMSKLKRDYPNMSSMERSKKVKDLWYNLPSHEQKKLRKEPLSVEKRKMGLKIRAQDIIDEEEIEEETEEVDEEGAYTQKIEEIETKYKPQMERIIGEIKQLFEEEGYSTSEVDDYSDEHLRLDFVVYKNGETEEGPEEDDVDISFQVAPSLYFDGSLEGVNFMVDIVSVGGNMIGGLIPYNYSDDVWADINDESAVEERFNIFNNTDPYEILSLVEGFWEGK